MTSAKKNARSIVCYSPRPLSTYKKTYRSVTCGPASSALLDTPESWNLAYLSHDFDKSLVHPDPHFTTHVRRSIQTRLDGSGFDLITSNMHELVGSLLRLPAPRFVHLIQRHPVLSTLPLYQAYGDAWLEGMERRSRFCNAEIFFGDHLEEDPMDLRLAKDVLDQIRAGGTEP